MPKLIDLIGQRFGRLVIIERVENDKWNKPRWLCQCNCKNKNEVIIGGSNLKSGHTRSCGCLKIEKVTKHGFCKMGKSYIIYKIWYGIKQRCYNTNHKYYHCYGSRGIRICKRWLEFKNFFKDMGERPNKKYSIDRINNNKNYYKSNCRWRTQKEQMRNTRQNRLETYNNKTQCIVEWAEEYQIPYHTLWKRIYKYGWSIERALTEQIKKKTNG